MLVLTTCRTELCILSFLNCLFLNEFLELEAGKYSEERIKGNALAIQWLGLHAFMPWTQVQSLVGDLRPRKLLGVVKK